MIAYSDYRPVPEPHVVIDGELRPVDGAALHHLAVNGMALAVGLPSIAGDGSGEGLGERLRPQ